MSSFYLEISKSYIKLLLGTTYEETKRSLNTEFALEGHVEGGGRSLLGNRGEGGSRAGKDGSDGELHLDLFIVFQRCYEAKFVTNLRELPCFRPG